MVKHAGCELTRAPTLQHIRITLATRGRQYVYVIHIHAHEGRPSKHVSMPLPFFGGVHARSRARRRRWMLAPLASSACAQEGAEEAASAPHSPHPPSPLQPPTPPRGKTSSSSFFVTVTSVGPLHPGSLRSNNTQPGAGGRQTPGTRVQTPRTRVRAYSLNTFS